jgi:ring-1,2-phenylacetyl-CoA epoxidase subunit PaaC
VKEARYHQQHSADWMVRLGRGTPESKRRMDQAVREIWHYHAELFTADEVDAHAKSSGLGPGWDELKEPWLAQMRAIFDEAGLAVPAEVPFISAGKQGVHTEHMGYILAELQYLQRAYPGGTW